MPTVIHELADAFLRRKQALAERGQAKTKLAGSDYFMPKSAKQDLNNRLSVFEQGGLPELLKQAGKEMYDNPIVNTAIGFAPVLGDIQAAGETMSALERGAPWQETAGYAAGMLPFVPALRTTWHGSPHGFTKFDMSKIGTGEGAQAYGHGLYLAEARPVAEEYKQALSNPEVVLKSGERITNPAIGSHEDVAKAWLEEQFLKGSKTPFDDAILRLNKLKSAANNPQQFEGAVDVLNKWKNEGASVDLGGYLYKVDLPDEQIAKMLDWDKPLFEQPEVMNQLRQSNVFGPNSPSWAGAPEGAWERNIGARTGSDFYLKNKWADDQAKGSAMLYEAGIPGIQYLDQASRNQAQRFIARSPQGGESVFNSAEEAQQFIQNMAKRGHKFEYVDPNLTRNYVVFSDEIPKILERNGTSVFEFPKD